MLFVIALEEGKIPGIDQNVLECFPDKQFENMDDNKKAMTLKHLLTMTAGIEWAHGTKDDPTQDLFYAKDPVRFVLDRPMAHKPGEAFMYNNGATQVLGQYIESVTGKTLSGYADEKLLAPPGIKDYFWQKISSAGRLRICRA